MNPNETKFCIRCQKEHVDDFRACPMVKAIEINLIGQITRVEFLTPMDFPPQQRIEEPEAYEKLTPRGVI